MHTLASPEPTPAPQLGLLHGVAVRLRPVPAGPGRRAGFLCCGERRLSRCSVRLLTAGLLLLRSSGWGARGLGAAAPGSGAQARQLWPTALAAPQHVGSSCASN